MDATEALGAPAQVTLCGKEYLIAQVGIGIMSDFEAWAKQKVLGEALEALGPGAVASERAALIRQMFLSMPGLIAAEMNSTTGSQKLLHLALLTHHPEITFEEVGRIVRVTSLQEIQALLDTLSGNEPKTPLGEILIGKGWITPEQLREALEIQEGDSPPFATPPS